MPAISIQNDKGSAFDEEKRGNERVQDLINEYNKIVDEKLKEKEKDLMTI